MSITTHLKERHFHTEKYSSVFVSEEHGKAYFTLYSFKGEIAGYQCYTPLQPKRASHLTDEDRRYCTTLTKRDGICIPTAYGLETITPETKEIFVCEGIFDACRLHELGLTALALLGSDICHLIEPLFALGIKIIPVCEGDKAGKKLAKLATSEDVIYLPEGFDLGDMEEKHIKTLFAKHKKAA